MEPFEKKDESDQKQKDLKERMKMIDNIVLKEGISLPKKIVLCDDTLTTGSTLKGALSTIDKSNHQIEIYCASMNRRWLEEMH